MQEHPKNHSVGSISGGQGDAITVLSDDKRIPSDAAMVRKAVRLGWPITDRNRKMVVDRLIAIVEKTSIDVPTKEGTVESEYHADSNAIAASRVLVGMDAQNQADAHLEAKTERLDDGKPTEIVRELRLSFGD